MLVLLSHLHPGCTLSPRVVPTSYGQTGTGKTHTMLGVDMWNMAVSEIAAQQAATGAGSNRARGQHHVPISATRVVETASRHKKEWYVSCVSRRSHRVAM